MKPCLQHKTPCSAEGCGCPPKSVSLSILAVKAVSNNYICQTKRIKDEQQKKQIDRSGMTSKSAFIKARIFGEPFHVVTFDKSQHDYYAKLSDFHAQFRMVGNTYNQTLKELKCHFSEHRAMALVCKLEKYMMQLVQIMHKVVELTIRYENHRIGKGN